MKILLNNKKGNTLISLLIGSVISLITISALLNIFKSSIQNSVGESGVIQVAEEDSRLGIGLLAIENKIQGAGFGVNNALVNQNFIALTDATITNGQIKGNLITIDNSIKNANALFFESNDTLNDNPNSNSCIGFLITPNNGIYILTKDTDCNPINSKFSSLTWEEQPIIENNILKSKPTFQISQTNSCSTYGVSTANKGLSLKINYTNQLNGATLVHSVCLSNYQ